jgi:hypothetical protein
VKTVVMTSNLKRLYDASAFPISSDQIIDKVE